MDRNIKVEDSETKEVKTMDFVLEQIKSAYHDTDVNDSADQKT